MAKSSYFSLCNQRLSHCRALLVAKSTLFCYSDQGLVPGSNPSQEVTYLWNFINGFTSWRRKAGLSQEELADLVGVTRQAVQKWESGASRPDLDNITALSDYFQVSLDYLIAGREREENQTAPATTVINNYYGRHSFEYKSKRTLFGLPLLHINCGPGLRWARGVIAVGNVATGLVALGGVSAGLLSLGGASLGLLLALGGVALGGVSIGAVAARPAGLGRPRPWLAKRGRSGQGRLCFGRSGRRFQSGHWRCSLRPSGYRCRCGRSPNLSHPQRGPIRRTTGHGFECRSSCQPGRTQLALSSAGAFYHILLEKEAGQSSRFFFVPYVLVLP